MAPHSALDRSDAPISLEVDLGGRRFPLNWDQSRLPAAQKIRKLREPTEDTSIPTALGETVWKLLAWSAVPPNCDQRQVLVEAYVQSLNQLAEFRRNVETMIRAACAAGIEFRQALGETNINARDAALDEKLDEMLLQAACDWQPARNVLDAKLVSQPIETLRERLTNSLRRAANDFGSQFFEMLAKLVDRELIGLVEWLPNNCCSYHFFRRIVIQENHGRGETRVNETRLFERVERNAITGQRIVGRQTVSEIAGHGVHYHRFARHEHEVMNAVATTIKDSRVVMPPQVVRLIEKIPDWLYPFVRVIDGDIFRERIIEREMKVSQWQDVQVRDEPIIGCEPGVIIGPYVLTGWGPREVAAELKRREQVAQQTGEQQAAELSQRRAPLFAGAAIVLTVVAWVLLVMSLRGAGAGFLAFVTTTAALGAIWQAAFDSAAARRNPTAAIAAHFQAGMFGGQLLLAEWLIARWHMPLSWMTPAILIVSALLCHALGRRFQ